MTAASRRDFKIRNLKGVEVSRAHYLLTAVVFMSLLLILCSCNGECATTETVKTTLVVAEEKYLTHIMVDNIASYGYEAENLVYSEAQGTTSEETLLILEESGAGSIGYLEPGLWKFTVRAYNAKGTLLYVGTSTANVSKDNNTVNVVLALQKEGTGTASFKVTSRCTGNDSSLMVYYTSHDETVGGFSEDFTCTCDGLTDTWTGSVELPENRYKLTVRLATNTTYIASDITDLLILNGETIDITGVLDGQENQEMTIVPIEPVIPEGYITMTGHMMAGNTVKATWNYSSEDKTPESVEWYLDGVSIGTGEEISLTLPQSGMHNISATAVLNGEYSSDNYKINICSQPIELVGGTIVKDYGSQNGEYWFDDYGIYYRKESGSLETNRYLVVNLLEEKSDTLYTYDEALEIEKDFKTLGYRLPTKVDAQNIIAGIKAGKLTFDARFWTSEEYNSTNAYIRQDNGVSTVSKTSKVRVILVRDI